jgi:prophage maintenance system killer protein
MIGPRWLSVDDIVHLHAMQIAEFGGHPGIRDPNLLDSAVNRPRQRFFYGELHSLVDTAVAYATALNANHPFLDGNKACKLSRAAGLPPSEWPPLERPWNRGHCNHAGLSFRASK